MQYVTNSLFPRLMGLEGAWGALSFIANRHLTNKTMGATLQARLLDFLMEDENLYNLYKHVNGSVYLHHGDFRLRLSSFHRLPFVNVEVDPVNIHPIDLWCSFRVTHCAMHTKYGIARYARKLLSTNINHLPPRFEFYNSPFVDGMAHGNQVSFMWRDANMSFNFLRGTNSKRVRALTHARCAEPC